MNRLERRRELRRELIKGLANVELQFLERLGNQRPIAEAYLHMDAELHIHFLAGRVLCATYRARPIHEGRGTESGARVSDQVVRQDRQGMSRSLLNLRTE